MPAPLPTPATSPEERLARYRETGDRRERNDVVEEHRHIAEACARRFRHRGEPLEDLVQVAMVGVLKAAERFDAAQGVPFAAFATVTARGELRRYHRDVVGITRVPRRLHDLVPSILAAGDILRNRHGRAPTPAEVARYLAITVDEVVEATSMRVRSCEPIPVDDGELPAVAHLAWEDGLVEAMDDRVSMSRRLERLSPDLQAIVRMRYVDAMSWAEIATAVDRTERDIRSALRRATRRLRAESADGLGTAGS